MLFKVNFDRSERGYIIPHFKQVRTGLWAPQNMFMKIFAQNHSDKEFNSGQLKSFSELRHFYANKLLQVIVYTDQMARIHLCSACYVNK